MWKVKYWQAVIDKSPPNVPRWKLTNVSDEIWRAAGAAWRPDNRRRNRVEKLNSNSLELAEVCLYAEFQQCQFILYFDSNWSLSSEEGRIEGKSIMVWAPRLCHDQARPSKKKTVFPPSSFSRIPETDQFDISSTASYVHWSWNMWSEIIY